MTNEDTSLEKYISHTLFLKGLWKSWCGLCVRGELETERDCHILTPSSSDHSSTSSSFCWAAQPGFWGPRPSVCKLILTLASCPPTNSNCNSNWTDSRLEMTQAVCGTGLYICLTSACFLWVYASTMSTGQGDIPTSLIGCTCYLHRCISWLIARSITKMLHYEFNLVSSAVSHMSCSSYLDGFLDGG